jgi:hypothetical protein
MFLGPPDSHSDPLITNSHKNDVNVGTSVPDLHPDPDSWDPNVFGPTGSASGSVTEVRIRGSGSVLKCHGTAALVDTVRINIRITCITLPGTDGVKSKNKYKCITVTFSDERLKPKLQGQHAIFKLEGYR